VSRSFSKSAWVLPACLVALVAASLAALCLGRYPLAPSAVLAAIQHRIGPGLAPFDRLADVIVFTGRLPRLIAAVLVGAALSLGGASYQSVFRNPLVSPSLLGVLAGAGFGAAFAIVLSLPAPVRLLLTFAGGAAAVGVGILVARLFSQDRGGLGDQNLLLLVFGGLVSTALFTALLSIMKFVADPNNQLPDIVFWLLGSLATVQPGALWSVAPWLVGGCLVMIWMARYLDVLVLSDDEARSLGAPAGALRMAVIVAATITSALTVAIAGTIGWVGLIVPHIARLLVGPSHRRLMPVCALLGAVFMVIADTAARSLTPSEIPLGVICDLVGVILFLLVLPRIRRGWV
jgi:iron complex transport system permease protein